VAAVAGARAAPTQRTRLRGSTTTPTPTSPSLTTRCETDTHALLRPGGSRPPACVCVCVRACVRVYGPSMCVYSRRPRRPACRLRHHKSGKLRLPGHALGGASVRWCVCVCVCLSAPHVGAVGTMADAAPYLIKIDDTKRRDDIGGIKNLVRAAACRARTDTQRERERDARTHKRAHTRAHTHTHTHTHIHTYTHRQTQRQTPARTHRHRHTEALARACGCAWAGVRDCEQARWKGDCPHRAHVRRLCDPAGGPQGPYPSSPDRVVAALRQWLCLSVCALTTRVCVPVPTG
jgi:hypothetical protein